MFGFDRFTLTDGTTELSLIDAPYALEISGTDLGVATLRPGTLGGNAPYTEVECSLSVVITGTCPANVYSAYTALWTMLDRAQRWHKGDGVSPIYLTIQAAGSSSLPVICTVLRRADADAPLKLPAVYEVTSGNYTMQGVELRFLRTGGLLGALETSTTSTAQQFANVMSVAFSAAAGTLPNPTRAVLDPNISPFIYPAILFIAANDVNNIAFVDAWVTGASTVDTSARGGTYYKFAALAAGSTTTIVSSTSLSGFNARRATLILSCRTPTSGVWQVRATINRSGPAVTSVLKTLDAGITTPRLLIFEDIVVESNTTITVTLSVINRTLAASDFDIDFLCLVATQGAFLSSAQNIEPTSSIIAVQAVGSSVDNLTIDPYVLNRGPSDGNRDRPYPLVYVGQDGPNIYASWAGDAWLTTQGNAPVAVLLANDGVNWRPMSGGSPVTTTLSMRRRRSHIVLP